MKVIKITNKQKREILAVLAQHYQGIGTALEYNSPFQLLIATALAAQTTDSQVNKVTRQFFADYPDVQSMRDLSAEAIIPYIQSLGLYKNKAKNVAATVQRLLIEYDGVVPADREALMTLPGIGRKTANVVLAYAFHIPAMAVDTHVFRVANRLGLAVGDTVEAVEKQLCDLIPQHDWADAHHWLIWHGRRCCKAQNPDCSHCPVGPLCPSYR